ncbi:type II toxin-antitoxin system VapB family antitoxin [Amycolatopsis sp. NPDC051045]|uniref:type II toxin-antitoxin system VapB family antitoxin n=1 Tax=Amycolatopsis sp. NPDC051045 TaxID=3156922 RepID=UPI00344AA562
MVVEVSTNVDNIDESTLSEAQEILGTKNKKDTVNAALREVVRKRVMDEFLQFMGNQDIEELDRSQAEAWRD